MVSKMPCKEGKTKFLREWYLQLKNMKSHEF